MPWFNVDDKAHSHPKMIKAGNAAVGLWLRCGSYVAQHLTDGVVPGLLAEMYGTEPQIRKLTKVGLWHPAGHGCPGCPQPPVGDYYMHDYHDPASGNPLRAEVEQRRKRAAEKKRRQRGASQGGPDGAPPRHPSLFDGEPDANDEEFDGEWPAKDARDFDDSAGQGGMSPGDSRARDPLHSNPLPTRGVDERESSAGSRHSSEPALSAIAADWQPSENDVAAAQLARTDGGREQLSQQQLVDVTRKFVRRMAADGRTAASWGARWQEWAERERPENGNVVPFGPGALAHGRGRQTKSEQQRAGLANLRNRLEGGTA
ncbi:hypothetical protein DMA15_12535 [Streptomyces sp. WAC 01529]|uniref:hypothetical protein n=1 Tax=Streptomyces sp. WAC 01529 TaxID=2203205 RepID=UPI000F6CBBC4|nr:hypothetical protein [Streptomyces sp. WAC 01529]AZM53312.1 hypothetical protein DMA15_12535 [Streptomyces sp. WAC 01529]